MQSYGKDCRKGSQRNTHETRSICAETGNTHGQRQGRLRKKICALSPGDSQPARSRGALELSDTPLPTYSALCAIGKGLFVPKNQRRTQASSFNSTTFTKLTEHTLLELEKSHRKTISFSILCFYFNGSCQICQEILPTLFSHSMAFIIWKMSNMIFHTVGIIGEVRAMSHVYAHILT